MPFNLRAKLDQTAAANLAFPQNQHAPAKPSQFPERGLVAQMGDYKPMVFVITDEGRAAVAGADG